MICPNLKFGTGHHHHFRENAVGYILTFDFKIGPTELKLWPFKDALFYTGRVQHAKQSGLCLSKSMDLI